MSTVVEYELKSEGTQQNVLHVHDNESKLKQKQATLVNTLLSFLFVLLLYTYLRRQQERGLMDANSVSFQMFLILLSSITLGSESQMSVFKQGQSNT